MPVKLRDLTAGQDVIATVRYGPAGEMTSLTNGAGGTESRAYNVNGQLTTLTLPGRTVTYTFPTQNNGKVSSITDSGETVNYGYDSLNRLTSAGVTSGWSQAFSYDGFGNMTSKTGTGGAPSWSSSVDPTTNRLNNAGITFDANGNQTALPMTAGMTDAFTASYDVDNRMIQVVNSASTMRSEYDYDSGNKRVWERRTGNGSGEWIYFFGADGQRMGRYTLTVGASTISFSQNQASVWFAGKLAQKVDASGTKSWPFEDRLGSVGKYLPYGEDKPGASNPANDNEKFATYTRDGGSGIDYADQRWYAQGIGRFTTPDPARQGRNHFAYSNLDPINNNDPTGLLTVIVGGFNLTGLSEAPWGQPGTPFHQAVSETFGESALTFTWSGTHFLGWEDAARSLRDFILLHMGFTGDLDQPLNIVAHSHGGNVVKAYTWLPDAPRIDTLINMGTPQYPGYNINPSRVGTYLNVYSKYDGIQNYLAPKGWFAWVGAILLGTFTGNPWFAIPGFLGAGAVTNGRTDRCAINIGIDRAPGVGNVNHNDYHSPEVWTEVQRWLIRAGYGGNPTNATVGYCANAGGASGPGLGSPDLLQPPVN
jgi:RHS repeat-associated protein